MNQSLLFIKKRLNNNPDFIMPVGWQNRVNIYNPFNVYKEYFRSLEVNGESLSCHLESDQEIGKKMKISVRYSPHEKFQYFANSETKHDGTIIFFIDNICRLLNKVLTLGTYCSDGISDDFITNPFNYDVEYVIGDIIVHSEFGEQIINEVRMSGQHDTAFIPIKFTFKLRE
jgi:hypothetical protein